MFSCQPLNAPLQTQTAELECSHDKKKDTSTGSTYFSQHCHLQTVAVCQSEGCCPAHSCWTMLSEMSPCLAEQPGELASFFALPPAYQHERMNKVQATVTSRKKMTKEYICSSYKSAYICAHDMDPNIHVSTMQRHTNLCYSLLNRRTCDETVDHHLMTKNTPIKKMSFWRI